MYSICILCTLCEIRLLLKMRIGCYNSRQAYNEEVRLMSRIQTDGIIWDIDGTLWDATGTMAPAWTETLRSVNAERTAAGLSAIRIHHPEGGGTGSRITAEDLRREFGKPLEDILHDLLPDLPMEEAGPVLDRWYAVEAAAIADNPPKPFEGTREVLKKLQAMQIPSFIVSNCQAGYIETFMRATHTEPYITDHLCPGDTALLKADNIQMIIRKHHLRHACYVGDIQADCDAVRKAGKSLGQDADIAFIWASYGYGHAEHPDAVLRRITDLTDVIRPVIKNIPEGGN